MGLWTRIRGSAGKGGRTSANQARQQAHEIFSAEVEKLARALPSVTSVRRKPDDFALVVVKNGREHTVFLGNVFAETRDLAQDQRVQRIQRLLAAIDEFGNDGGDWDEVKERLVPLLRSATAFIEVREDCTKTAWLSRSFQPFLIETVAIDAENSFQYVQLRMLEMWGVEADEVFTAAHETAANCFSDADIEPYDPRAPYPIWHVARDDNYETSRLFLPGWLAAFSSRVIGRAVAIIPERSTLIVGGDGDERCLRRLVDTARREYEASTRSISPALYTVEDVGTIVPLVLPAAHPLANDVALGHVLLASREYSAQQKPLQTMVGDNLFVATYVGIQRNDGTITSTAVWAEQIATLLPKVEEITLVPNAKSKSPYRFQVPWSAVERIAAGHLSCEPGLDPPRWRTRGWPDEAILARLREAQSGSVLAPATGPRPA